jgi:hypothetical protein
MKTTDHQTTEPQQWAPSPEKFARLQAEATEAARQSVAGVPITSEQGSLVLWACSPLPELFPPAHLKG